MIQGRIKTALAIVASVLLFSSFSLANPWDINKLVGAQAPEFTLKDLKGREISLTDFQGKLVLLNFWATWCPSCKEEIPSLNRLQKRYKDRGLVVIGIASESSLKRVKDFSNKYNIQFLILHDSSITVTRKYSVFALPTTFLIDRRGKIVEKFIGAYRWDSKEITDIIDSY